MSKPKMSSTNSLWSTKKILQRNWTLFICVFINSDESIRWLWKILLFQKGSNEKTEDGRWSLITDDQGWSGIIESKAPSPLHTTKTWTRILSKGGKKCPSELKVFGQKSFMWFEDDGWDLDICRDNGWGLKIFSVWYKIWGRSSWCAANWLFIVCGVASVLKNGDGQRRFWRCLTADWGHSFWSL